MGAFFSRFDPKTAKLRWWLHITGKGDKERLVTTSIYLHTEDDARHAAISASHHLGWEAVATPTE